MEDTDRTPKNRERKGDESGPLSSIKAGAKKVDLKATELSYKDEGLLDIMFLADKRMRKLTKIDL